MICSGVLRFPAMSIPSMVAPASHSWRTTSRGAGQRNLEAVEFATLEWVDWYNNRRLLEPIGNIPPAEAEARYYAAQQEVALAA
jgi:transposase InsO family protein